MGTEQERKRLVAGLVASGYVYGNNVIAAMEKVERHRFLPTEMESVAYIDSPLLIGEGQTISAPHMVGMMASGLELRPGLRVLEIGGGSGYHAAVLAELVRPDGHVYSIERIQSLADSRHENLESAGYARPGDDDRGGRLERIPGPSHRTTGSASPAALLRFRLRFLNS